MSLQKREHFFRIIFGENSGYICISIRKPGTKSFEEEFFSYPEKLPELLDFVQRFSLTHDVYYCAQLLSRNKRVKEAVIICPTVWADLDTCEPSKMLVAPTISIQSSPNRFQALWKLVEPIEPSLAEDLSRRIAYYHSDDGADKSGWDLTQLLRVPFTYNHKYQGAGALPQVTIVATHQGDYSLGDFEAYPPAEGFEHTSIPFPEQFPAKDPETILDEYRSFLPPQVWNLFSEVPQGDWSKSLWVLENYLFEGGMSREEVFVVAKSSACNKYARDNRSTKLLWSDVCRAWSHVESKSKGSLVGPQQITFPDLLTESERESCKKTPTIVEEYIEWAKTLGDAAWQYHEAAAFIVLSSLLSGSIRLPTSYGTLSPNLWFMILADTTITRKSTAMDLAMDLVSEIDTDVILATDGSIEGLMTALSMRPGRPSVFLRDEFSGLLESLTKKDYYAGMGETLTKLYDGKLQKRILRKETIEVRDPVLILFAGGIKTRILSLLTVENIASGFIPRFVLVTAESDISSLKPLGPPTDRSLKGREDLITNLKTLYDYYTQDQLVRINGKEIAQKARWEAELTPKAWSRYNALESSLINSALQSSQAEILTPSFDRLAKSGLKVSLLIAASRNLDNKIVVEEEDIVRAFYYVEKWRTYTYEVVRGVGKSITERIIERVLVSIQKKPGILRSVVMQNHHLTSRDADNILGTLEQRGLISRVRSGRSERLNPAEV